MKTCIGICISLKELDASGFWALVNRYPVAANSGKDEGLSISE